MKILLAVHHFPPRYKGGAEWEAYRIAKELIARRNFVKVVSIENIFHGIGSGITWENDLYDGIPVHRLSMNLKHYPDPDQWEYKNNWIGEHLDNILSSFSPDIFHLISGYLFSGSTLFTVKKRSIPTIVSLMDYYFLCRRLSLLRSDGQLSKLPIDPYACARCIGEEKKYYHWLGRVFPRVMKYFWHTRKEKIRSMTIRKNYLMEQLNHSDLIIARSNFIRTMYIQAGALPEKIVFQRQGLDSNYSENFPRISKTSSHKLRIAYIGQISNQKGVHVVIQAVRSIQANDVELKIYGNVQSFPKYSKRLVNLIGDDDRIKFSGVFVPEEMNRIYQDIDIVVLPSIWYENSPNVILEAFERKTPVIASNLGGMAELVIHGKDGLLFESSNPFDLASKISLLIEKKNLIEDLSRGIEPVKSLTREVDELEEYYSRVLAEKQKRKG